MFPKIGGKPPKMDGENNGKPLSTNGWFGGKTHYFRKHPYITGNSTWIDTLKFNFQHKYPKLKCCRVFEGEMAWMKRNIWSNEEFGAPWLFSFFWNGMRYHPELCWDLFHKPLLSGSLLNTQYNGKYPRFFFVAQRLTCFLFQKMTPTNGKLNIDTKNIF